MPGVLREYWNGGFTEYIECTFSDKGFKKKLKIIHQCYQNMLVRRVEFLKNRNIRNTRFVPLGAVFLERSSSHHNFHTVRARDLKF